MKLVVRERLHADCLCGRLVATDVAGASIYPKATRRCTITPTSDSTTVAFFLHPRHTRSRVRQLANFHPAYRHIAASKQLEYQHENGTFRQVTGLVTRPSRFARTTLSIVTEHFPNKRRVVRHDKIVGMIKWRMARTLR